MDDDLNRILACLNDLSSTVASCTTSVSKKSHKEKLDAISKQYERFKAFYGTASRLYAAIDEAITSINNTLSPPVHPSSSLTTSKPKKKFAFRAASTLTPPSSSPKTITAEVTLSSVSKPTAASIAPSDISTSPSFAISQKRDVHLAYPSLASLFPTATTTVPISLTISEITDSYIDLQQCPSEDEGVIPISALYLTGVKNSLVRVEADGVGASQPWGAKMSILMRECEGCLFILSGHQLRIHDSKDCVILLASQGGAILERCSGIQFGNHPYALAFLQRQDDHLSSFTFAVNDIKDFDHPFASKEHPSPSYSIYPNSSHVPPSMTMVENDVSGVDQAEAMNGAVPTLVSSSDPSSSSTIIALPALAETVTTTSVHGGRGRELASALVSKPNPFRSEDWRQETMRLLGY